MFVLKINCYSTHYKLGMLLLFIFAFAVVQAFDEATLERKLDSLQNEVTKLEKERNELNSQLQRLQLKARLDENVINLDQSAFSVTLSADKPVSDDNVVVFDQVITDNLADYNPTFGFFACRNAGLHLFTVTASTPAGESATVYLRHLDGATEVPMFISTYMADSSDQSGAHTATVIVNMGVGDTVSVVASGAITLAGGATVFSGYFL